MKKADIKAGVLYGYAKGTSEYRNAHPVIVLDASTLWTWHRSSGRERRQWKLSNAKRFTSPSYYSSYRGDEGYLVLSAHSSSPEIIDTLKELYAEFAATPGNPDAVNDLARKVDEIREVHMDVVNNRWIVGDFEEAKAEEDQRRRTRDALHKAERDRAAAEREFMDDVAAILSEKLERSVTVALDRSYGQTRASLSINDLAEFFGIKAPKDRL